MTELIFVHVPKTGGISFWQTLRQVYGEEGGKQIFHLLPYSGDEVLHRANSDMFLNHWQFRKTVNEHLRDVDYPAFFGHVPVWILEDVWAGVPRITWMRNPIDQVLSRVFHWRKENIEGARNVCPKELALSPVFRNNQSFYTGDSLKNFAYVGILEHYNECLAEIAGMFGWQGVIPLHDHPTNYEDDMRQALKANAKFCAQLRDANYRDMALYDYALHMRGHA